MCNFFSCVATRDGRILFTEQNHHSEIIMRANLRDTDLHLRHFVRLECVPPFDSVTVDEQGTLPGWFENERASIEARVIELAKRVASAWEQYEAVERPAREQYQAVELSAWEQYKAVERPAREQYKAVKRSAWEQYKAVERPAREQYKAVLSTITGYLPAVIE